MSFAENLKAFRTANRMTMESLAILVGTSRQTIQRYESGRITTPPYERIEALAAALGVLPGELMGWRTDAAEDDPALDMETEQPHIMVTDDAMASDRILERDIVCYRPTSAPPDGAIVVLLCDGLPMARRLWHTEAGDILVASNTAYPPMCITPVNAHRFTILGVATILKSLL